jgi:isochorismate pyruvate lyase
MKLPKECQNIEEVRACIDSLDAEIIALLAKRFEYVKAVVPFKNKTTEGIIAEERRLQVLKERRLMAEKNGLNPDVIESIYKKLIQYFINEELKLIEQKKQ